MTATLVATWPPGIHYEFAFNTSANSFTLPPHWQGLSDRVQSAWRTQRGRQYELDTNTTGKWTLPLANADGALDPSNTASPYAPNILPFRPCRIRVQTGVNLLSVDQARCGQGTPFAPGLVPARMGVTNDAGYPVNLVASANAYTGTQVYQTTLPSTAAAGTTVLLVPLAQVIPGANYAFTAETLITSGTSTPTSAAILWYGEGGVSLGTTAGSSTTITSGSSTWTALTASGQAPTGASPALYAALRVVTGGALSASTTWQVGGLQFEASATPTSFQIPQTLGPNLLPQAIATGTASINPVTDSAANWFYPTVGSVGQATFLSASPAGQTTAAAWTTPSGTTVSATLYAGVANSNASAIGPVQDCVQVTAGVTYAGSVYLSRVASADTTVQVNIGFRWHDANGNLITPSTGAPVTVLTSGWVRASINTAAPAGAVWGRPQIFITSPAPTTATNVIYTTAWQMEAAASASTWADPGPTFQIFNGSVERWPQSWTLSGTYGQTGAIGVDAFALLAQGILGEPFVNELLILNPNFLYQLSDPSSSTAVVDTAARRPAAPIENSPFGAGSLVLGNPITAASSVGGVQGTSGTVATFNNNASFASPLQFAETIISLHKTTVVPGPPASGPWSRMVCFRATTTPGAGKVYNLWTAYPPSWTAANNSVYYIAITTSGDLSMQVNNAALGGLSYTGTTDICDSNWHQIIISFNPSGSAVFYLDGVQVASGSAGVPTGCVSDLLGCSAQFGTNQYNQGYVGDMAFAAEFPVAFTAAQVANLYNSWRTASTGDSSGQRTQRVLAWSGYQGPTAIETGSTVDMGPAGDIAGSTSIDASTALLPGGVALTGGSAIQGLNTVAQTENGNVYISNNGLPTFKARSDRYNQTVPVFVFGENTANGEWPYEKVGFDFDTSHLYSNIQATQYASSQVASADSASAQTQYGQRVYQLTMNQASFSETQDAATYLLGRYDKARQRIPGIVLHPSAVPGLWTVCLQLEIGTRIRVMRRPPYPAPPTQFDGFVESVAWNVDPKGAATVTLQCSPADATSYWTLGALQTTLAAQAASAQNQATINALPDSALNPLSSSLPGGYQLTFDSGTAIAETMTITAGGIPATTPGYMTATLTFTTNFVHTHASGNPVCEPLPAGYTNPATWNPATVLGAAGTTLAAAASSGTSSISINTLPDSMTNAASSDFNAGDLLWIGVGGSDFEGYNLLLPNLATAGGGALPLAAGTGGAVVGLYAGLGSPTVTASGSAFQGSTVWQETIGGSASTPGGLLYINKSGATAGATMTASLYARSITSGANPQVYLYIEYLGAAGQALSTASSSTVTLTGSASATWTRPSISGSAPTGTAWVQIGLVLTGTSPSSAWNFQADGLQLEVNATASTFGVCPQVLSMGTSVPGYTTATINLATPLANNHVAGESVCDPLPPATTSPTAVVATTRLTY